MLFECSDLLLLQKLQSNNPKVHLDNAIDDFDHGHSFIEIMNSLNLKLYETLQIFTRKSGGFYFYSLSINSFAVGGSGLSPFLFLISANMVGKTEFGTGVQALKCVFHIAFPAVCPLITSERSKVSDAGISPVKICTTPFCSMFSTFPL